MKFYFASIYNWECGKKYKEISSLFHSKTKSGIIMEMILSGFNNLVSPAVSIFEAESNLDYYLILDIIPFSELTKEYKKLLMLM